MRLSALLLITLVVSQPFGCGSRPSADEAQRRLLKRQQIKRHNRLFYVGLANAATMDSATGAAFAAITKQLDWLPKDGRHVLEGLYRVDRAVTDSDGQVHVLAVLERQAAADHLNSIVKKRTAGLTRTLDGCAKSMKRGELAEAKRCMEPATAELKKIQELATAAATAVGDPAPAELPEAKRVKELNDRLTEAGSRRKVVLVRVLRVIDQQPAGNLDVMFSRVATESGYRLVDGRPTPEQVRAVIAGGGAKAMAELGRKAGAGYVVVGEVKARFTSEESGQYFAWARGQLRVIDTAAAKVVAELSNEQIKGGHVSRKQACEQAVDNAANGLREALKAKLAELD